MSFTDLDIDTIAKGVNRDGVRYLELFLKEYTSIFHETVSPGCNKCLTQYLSRYKNHFKTMSNTSNYRLHAKYENIPLEFGSQVLVNNGNMTDEYAQKLLKHPDGERYFAQMPEGNAESKSPKKEEAITVEHLQDNLKKAEKALEDLPAKSHHKTKEKLVNAVNAAKEALESFKPSQEEEFEDIETVELEIKQEDLDRVPGLVDAGYEVGDKVLVDVKDFDVVGEITITNIVEDSDKEEKPE